MEPAESTTSADLRAAMRRGATRDQRFVIVKGSEPKKMKLKKIAADTRDPIASVVFSLLGVAGALGWIPKDLDANTLAEIVGLLMGALAGVFSFVHHRDFKQAIHASLSAQAESRSSLDHAADGLNAEGASDKQQPEGQHGE